MSRFFVVSLSVLGLAACPSDSEPEPEAELDVSFIDAPRRARLVRAVMTDHEVARWIGTEIQRNPPSCAGTSGDTQTIVITSTGECDTGTGSRFTGTVHVFDAQSAFPSFQFFDVHIIGERSTDAMELDGIVSLSRDPQSQVLAVDVDLTVTRDGIEVHTALSYDVGGDEVIADGGIVELGGRSVPITGALRDRVSIGNYDFTPGGDCGTGETGESICLYSPTPSSFTEGALSRMTATCTEGESQLQFTSRRLAQMRAVVGLNSYEINRDPESEGSLFRFSVSDPTCDASNARSYSVTQTGSLTLSYRSELMTIPRVTWGHERP